MLTCLLITTKICAHAEGRDACGGDSGGPLLLWIHDNDDDDDPKVIQVGVVSWGEGCASELPGVYAKLSFGIKLWMDNYIHAVNGNSEEKTTIPKEEASTSTSSSAVGGAMTTTTIRGRTNGPVFRIIISLSMLSYFVT